MKKTVEKRLTAIQKYLLDNEKATVKDLSVLLQVTPEMIRKDLTFLEEKGFLFRTHGGAVLRNSNIDIPISIRSKEKIELKKQLCSKAIDLIHDEDCLFIDPSSTLLHLGNLIYALVAVRLLLTYPPCDMEITVDGQRRNFQKVHFVTGMNLPYEGGGFRFCPDARPDDGRLSCMVVHGMNPLKILILFPTAYFGKHTGFRGITLLEGKSIQIRSASPCKIHRDGEFGGVSDQVVFRAGDGDVSLIVG